MANTQPTGSQLEQQLDFNALTQWMIKQGLAESAANPVIRKAEHLTGGTQNLIVRFEFAGRSFVLRTAAPTAYANGSKTMRREATLLHSLADTQVPHAHLIAACEDENTLGRAFYLMEPIDGFNVGTGMPEPHRSDPKLRRQMGFALIDGLAALRKVDYQAVGLTDFGNPEGFLDRQVSRWQSQLQSYDKYPGWPGVDGLPNTGRIGQWLQRRRPSQFKPGIQHGDYHIKNVLFRPDNGQLAAIIDWELATIGDPMIDLGWLLATWHEDDGSPGGTPIVVEPWSGFPTRDELIDYYQERTGEDVSQAHWYGVFACYKLALLLEGTYARSCAGKADRELGLDFHQNARRLLERAEGWIA